MTDRWIRTTDDVLAMLDEWFEPETDRRTPRGASAWWDEFYSDRSRPVPFFAAKRDENLAAWVDAGQLRPGRVLELGCGPGRNAVWLARSGFTVDAIDLSPAAVAWASERAREAMGSCTAAWPTHLVSCGRSSPTSMKSS